MHVINGSDNMPVGLALVTIWAPSRVGLMNLVVVALNNTLRKPPGSAWPPLASSQQLHLPAALQTANSLPRAMVFMFLGRSLRNPRLGEMLVLNHTSSHAEPIQCVRCSCVAQWRLLTTVAVWCFWRDAYSLPSGFRLLFHPCGEPVPPKGSTHTHALIWPYYLTD